MKWVTILTAAYPQDILIPQSNLEARGIHTFLKDEYYNSIVNFYPNSNVKLQVPEDEYDTAAEILKAAGYEIMPKPPESR
ncbi:MAG TPA: DUF2007 domain-containing protein [Bacteroidales bacterium]|nr:DUF2007 domain-containing protein [Bacteroidales bacterium]HRR48452.1 DUF2007 domain-containing protein [Bacteroidales bacterium]HRT32874.1 DUF2007 domain-containing protein [Bacteroidales bacterium]HRT83283.1 DUF2007 domain-containing protein [Bacteroidales bacterium]